jgi:hypothetical protein
MELDELHEGVNRSLSKVQVRSLGFCDRVSQTDESDAATAADRVAAWRPATTIHHAAADLEQHFS